MLGLHFSLIQDQEVNFIWRKLHNELWLRHTSNHYKIPLTTAANYKRPTTDIIPYDVTWYFKSELRMLTTSYVNDFVLELEKMIRHISDGH